MKAAQARVLLTGASGGIGQAMLQALTAAGAQVLGVGRGDPVSGCTWVRADLATEAGREMVVQAAAAFQVNVVVHAAGVPAFGRLQDAAPAAMQAVLQLNLLSPMALTQALLPQLQQRGEAQIVFVGSALGRIGVPGFSVYGASKAGLAGFAEALRRELAGSAVRVQLLAPRGTRTAFNSPAVEAYNRATGTAMDPPERVAAALVELIESGAAERTIGFPERLAVRLNGLLGPLLDSSFSRHRQSLPAALTSAAPLPVRPLSQRQPGASS